LPTDYVGLAELGLIAGVGMFIALVANLTVLPALLALLPPQPRHRAVEKSDPWLVRAVRRNGRLVIGTAMSLAVVAAFAATQARFDFDPLALRDPDTESVATLFDLMADEQESRYKVEVLVENLTVADALAAKLADLPDVNRTITLSNYVPSGQDTKIDQITDLAFLLQPSLETTSGPPPGLPDRATAYESLNRKLAQLTAQSAALWPGARRLSAAFRQTFSDVPGPAALDELESRLLAYLPGQLESLRLSLEADHVGIGDLPEFLRERMLAADGRAKVEAAPRERLYGDQEAIANFVTAVRTVAPHASGAPVTILEAGNAVVTAFAEAAVLSVVAIAVLLLVVVRNARDAVLIFVPLMFAALLTVAVSGLFNLPFNFANIIVLPLLFGLGVANGIHLVLRDREGSSGDASAGSTPRAVVFSALTTLGSFASIAMSSHPGTASMGVLLTIAISLTLVCTLVVLPALMVVIPGGKSGERVN
ncbi:MAG: MMPL family transporter, partial [Proteobacteria bacterium]|nr:MMPL family transporter [Pseudomonadota bacterium]